MSSVELSGSRALTGKNQRRVNVTGRLLKVIPINGAEIDEGKMRVHQRVCRSLLAVSFQTSCLSHHIFSYPSETPRPLVAGTHGAALRGVDRSGGSRALARLPEVVIFGSGDLQKRTKPFQAVDKIDVIGGLYATIRMHTLLVLVLSPVVGILERSLLYIR